MVPTKKKRTWFYWLLGGGLLGGTFSTWLAPKMISWYFEPPAQIGVSCRPAVEWALIRYKYAQMVGFVVGAVITLVILIIRRRRGNSGDITFSPDTPL